MVHQAALQIGLNCFINAGNICHDRANIGLLYTFVGTPSHTPRQENLAIGYVGNHLSVAVLRDRVKAMTAWVVRVVVFLVFLPGKLGMAHLVAGLVGNYFPVFDGNHDV
jgi:hypothetical protein